MTDQKWLAEQERYLRGFVGAPEEDIPLLLRDNDLWVLEPARRWPLDGPEAVRQWEEAAGLARALSHLGEEFQAMGNVALCQLCGTSPSEPTKP